MNQTQRIKIKTAFRNTANSTITGFFLGSLYSISIWFDLLRTDCEYKDNVASYANDASPYSCATDITSVTLEMQSTKTKLFGQFKNINLKANPAKFHILSRPKNQSLLQLMESSFPWKITRSHNKPRKHFWKSYYKFMPQS